MSERVRNVNSTDTLRTGAAEAGADPDDENRIDFGTLFPAKGDSRRPPEWFGRALLYVALAVIVFMFCGTGSQRVGAVYVSHAFAHGSPL